MIDEPSMDANRNPAIERMMAIVTELQETAQGLGLKALSERTGVTRSTVYRILNSLEAHGMVRQIDNGAYVLGSRLIALGNAVSLAHRTDLPRLLQPVLEQLARTTGETAKVSVYDRGAVFIVAGCHATTPHALNYTLGEQLPLHAGGASKVLLAALPGDERKRMLREALPRLTACTITDPAALETELARIRDQGWAHDPGEFSLRTQSYAAPIRDSRRDVVAALSIPFLATSDLELHDAVRQAALRGAAAMTAVLVENGI